MDAGKGGGGTPPPRKDGEKKDDLVQWLQWAYAALRPLALALALAALVFHTARIAAGYDTCAMLQGAPGAETWLFGPPGHWWQSQWRPTGCIMHQYHQSPAAMGPCLQDRWLAFVGDSRARQLFQGLLSVLSPDDRRVVAMERHADADLNVRGVRLTFHWRPEMADDDVQSLYNAWSLLPQQEQPSAIVHSAGSWALKRGTRVEDIAADAATIMSAMNLLQSPVYWVPLGHVVEERLWDVRKNITNAAIEDLDRRIGEESRFKFGSRIAFVGSARFVYAGALDRSDDGLHFDMTVQHAIMDIVLGLHCPKWQRAPPPFPASCCVPAETPSLMQIFALALGLAVLALAMCTQTLSFAASAREQIEGHSRDGASSAAPPTIKWKRLCRTLAEMTICMCYMYICDRTSLFLKEGKEYSPPALAVPLLLFGCVGIGTVRRVRQSGFLNRDQTDEWKGWMQLVFLVYHYVGASAVLPVYVIVRVLVAAYIFMTGYGHFCYFYNRTSSSWLRLAQVLFRVNIYTMFLCIVMNRTYLFYYFVPLTTFWFLMVYATMAIKASWNTSLSLLGVKIAVLFLLSFVLWWPDDTGSSPAVRRLFSLPGLYELFQLHGSLHEWDFRSRLDRFAAPFGMLLGLLWILLSTRNSSRRSKTSESDEDSLEQAAASPKELPLSPWEQLDPLTRQRLHYGAFGASILVLVTYGHFALNCHNKPECNSRHAIVSPLMVLAYVVLRNASTGLRSHYSWFFAVCGKVSLDLFLSQYHIWLARDTAAVLVILPGMPWLNVTITSLIYMYVSQMVAQALSSICGLLLPRQLSDGAVAVRMACVGGILLGFKALSLVPS